MRWPHPRWLEALLERHRTRVPMPACARRRCASSASIAWIPPACWWRATAPANSAATAGRRRIFRWPRRRCSPAARRRSTGAPCWRPSAASTTAFFLYCEDTDLGLRARWAGWKCLYVPEAVVEHHYSHSAGGASPLKAYYVERNRLFVLVKNFPARHAAGGAVRHAGALLVARLVPARGPRQRRPLPRGRPRRAENDLVRGARARRPAGARCRACGASGARSGAARASRRRSSATWCAATPSAPERWRRCDARGRSRFPAGDRAGVQRRRRHRRRWCARSTAACPACRCW